MFLRDVRSVVSGVKNPIRYRLIRIVLLAIGSTSLLTALANSWLETGRFNEARQNEAFAIAHIFSAAVSDSVARGDKVGAQKALRGISKLPSFKLALIHDKNNKIFAELGGGVRLRRDDERYLLFRRNLRVSVPIIKAAENIGRITVLVDTSDLIGLIIDELIVGLLATFVAGVAGLIIAIRLQERITLPLRDLTQNMLEIRKTQNFKRVVVRRSDDETGLLVDTFNDMMAHIAERDGRLERHRENLESEVENRTVELKEAMVAAESANAAKSSFLATMSHEIRTPMNGILVMAELLARTKMRPQHKRYADVIVRSGESLMAIINDILDFSKIESGKLDFEKIEVDVSETTGHVLNLFWERARSSGIDIGAHIEADVPDLIEGDPVRINQIISNLLNNALKFTDTGSVFLTVRRCDDPAALMSSSTSSTSSKASGSHTSSNSSLCSMLEFSVSDTGIGIAEDKLDDIFKSFSQADQSTTRQFGGTGLGLAICKNLVEGMGGKIWVESLIGEGSTFKFTLPLSVPLNELIGDAGETGLLAEVGGADLAGGNFKRALVVGALPASSRAIGLYLGDYDVEVEYIDGNDVGENDLNGVDVVFAGGTVHRHISNFDLSSEDLPIGVVVSSPGNLDDASVFELGLADDVLMCPVDRTDMGRLIKRLDRGDLPLPNEMELQGDGGRGLCRFAGMRVLVADDNEINLEVAREALHQLNVDVAFAHDGREAVLAVAENEFDAVLMDCSMPVLNGFDATREIRRVEVDEGTSHLPIIALTAHIAGGVGDEWRQAGMDRYLTKPFSISKLSSLLADLCPGRLVGDANAPSTSNGSDLLNFEGQGLGSTMDVQGRAVLDVSQLSSITGLDNDAGHEMIVRILHMFGEHAPVAMNKLNCANISERVEIANAAHALKSMCSNIGAERLFHACEVLEKSMRQDLVGDPGDLIGDVEMELELVLHEIHKGQIAA